ncbi:MAG: glycosyltransferase family 2 protein, partial [Patescibacteria group bacterium]|nr:glycosyltransferase family 2 protein [Patescibacteria group bacterium]
MRKVVVVMTCRNEEAHLEKTLLSLESQSRKSNEVIIVDDASTDKTFEIVKQFAQRNEWSYHKREKNNERYTSIPNALKIATSMIKSDFDYLMILDGDTILEPQYVEKLIKKMEEDLSLGLVGGSLKITTENGIQNYINDSKIVFGCNRIYTKKCWYDINNGKILNVNSVAWDNEHSQKALNRGYEVSRFDEIISHAQRIPTLQVPPFLAGKLRYQFGYSLPRS